MVRQMTVSYTHLFEITRGLEGRHIALWQSHGKYYINNKDKWGCLLYTSDVYKRQV